MKKLNLMIIVTVFTMILFCSCAQNNDVMASVNGIDIKKSDYEVRLKSNEIMAELMTEDINNSDFTSEEKNAKIMEIKEKCSTDKETIINSMIETAFIDSKYDVMICTTIIETGIDIPNVNTLIVLDADKFGLSQLYQIRGRIGRSDKIGYAYLMYNDRKELNDIAVKRLNTIKEFTELGSGFKIAMRDLSIRGAGDILGSEQSGFIDSIGIDLYLKMLKDAVDKLKGKNTENSESDNSDNKSLINVDTYISDDYVNDDDLKIELHKKINSISSLEELFEIKAEIENRFGKINREMELYMYEELFEKLAKKIEVINVVQTNSYIDLELSSQISKKIDGESLFLLAYDVSENFRLKFNNNKIHIILDFINLDKHFLVYLIEISSRLIDLLKKESND